MSNPNVNLSNLDARYSKPSDLSAAIAAQATTDAGQYAPIIMANGTDQTAQINTALASPSPVGSKVVRLVGNFTTTGALVVPSKTTLDASDARITLAPGTKSAMVRNASTVPVRTTADAAITASTTTLTSSTAAFTSADVGRAVAIIGAALPDDQFAGSYPQADHVATIISITDANTAVLDQPATKTASATTLNIYNRDTNVSVIGGWWDRGANGVPTTSSVKSWDLFTTHLAHIDGLQVRNLTVRSRPVAAGNGPGWHVSTYDVSNFLIDNITLDGDITIQATDGIHITGPARRGIIRNVYGVIGDDAVAIMPVGPTNAFPQSCGSVSDIVVENIFATTSPTTALVKIHGGGGQAPQGITVRGIHGTGGLAVSVPSGTGNVNDILIEDIDFDLTGTQPPILLGMGTCQSVTVRNLRWRTTAPNLALVYVPASATITKLTIDNVDVQAQGQYVASVLGVVTNLTVQDVDLKGNLLGGVYVDAAATVDYVNIRNVKASMRGTDGNFLADFGTVNRFSIEDVRMSSFGNLVWIDTVAPVIKGSIARVTLDGCKRIISISNSIDVSLDDIEVINVSSPATPLIDLRSLTGPTVILRGRGLKSSTSFMLGNVNAAAKPRVLNPDWQCDVSIIAKNRGDMAYHANTSVAPYLPGPAICDGTDWKPMASMAASYTSGVMTAGAITFADARITANSIIRLGISGPPSANAGALYVYSLTAGTGFTVKSTNAADTSRVYYEIARY